MEPVFFATPLEWRTWLERNHATATELWVGLYKRGTGRAGMTWPESVDQALCFGWIDGVRRSLGEERYVIRFTPRRPGSTWSRVNLKRIDELEALGLVHPAGRAVHAARDGKKAGTYSYERRDQARLTRGQEREFRGNKAAWKYFQAQPAWYRKTAIHWVTSASREETRARRLAILIADSAASRPIGPLNRKRGAAAR